MAIVCPSCDHEAPAPTSVGAPCPKCGERLIVIDTRDPLIGSTIDGRFEIAAKLGQGGMGVVYRALQLSIGREVAVKVLDARMERDVAAVKRFFREAKLASALAHPNTVPIIDFGQDRDGRLYLVMELVKGKTLLAETVDVGPLPLARIVTIGVQLCEALEAAHGLAIVHRDLKLENVMLLDGPRDHVKVLDFGLARSLSDPNTHATGTGIISGTPRYMPPEVALEAAAPTAAQDMYALGVMLAELATGRALWAATTFEALITKKLAIETALVDVPPVLHPLVTSLLAIDPTQRPNASETRETLRALDVSAPSKPERVKQAAPESAPPKSAPELPDYSKAELVGIDELGGPPIAKSVVAVPAPPRELEVDSAWLAERSQKQAAYVPPVARKRRGNVAGVIVALLFIGLVTIGAYALYNYKRAPTNRLPAVGISIDVRSEAPLEVLIDGKRAGTTPFSLKLPTGSKPFTLTAPGVDDVRVVPDHDQTVELR
jgi:serine/threonine protein kinase